MSVLAVAAVAAGPAQPWHPHPLAGIETGNASARRHDPADDFVPWHDRQGRVRQFAVDEVQVGAAHAAGFHLEQDLPGAGLRDRQLATFELLPGREGIARIVSWSCFSPDLRPFERFRLEEAPLGLSVHKYLAEDGWFPNKKKYPQERDHAPSICRKPGSVRGSSRIKSPHVRENPCCEAVTAPPILVARCRHGDFRLRVGARQAECGALFLPRDNTPDVPGRRPISAITRKTSIVSTASSLGEPRRLPDPRRVQGRARAGDQPALG